MKQTQWNMGDKVAILWNGEMRDCGHIIRITETEVEVGHLVGKDILCPTRRYRKNGIGFSDPYFRDRIELFNDKHETVLCEGYQRLTGDPHNRKVGDRVGVFWNGMFQYFRSIAWITKTSIILNDKSRYRKDGKGLDDPICEIQ